MKKIGFTGGGLLCELGPLSDVVLFFDCVKDYVERDNPGQDWSLLTDRLYRRYLRLDELDSAETMMRSVYQIFSKHAASSAIRWDPKMVGNSDKTWLSHDAATLAEVFDRYFDAFARCAESAKFNYETFKSYPGYVYEPVRVIVADLVGFADEKNRPLSEYDALQGLPFWLQ